MTIAIVLDEIETGYDSPVLSQSPGNCAACSGSAPIPNIEEEIQKSLFDLDAFLASL